MDIARGLAAPLPALARPVATIGGFDGVHRGHQAVLARAVAWARRLGGQAVALTFDPLPKAYFAPDEAHCITSLEHRLLLLGRCAIDLAVVLAFDDALAHMPPETFVRRVLLDWLGARHVVLGFNSTFGHGGQGNADLLRQLQARGLLEVRVPGPIRHGGTVVSSTAIRQAIRAGDLGEAAAMLGRPVALLGTVVPGDGRGRSLGFPTANLDLHHEVAPPAGVYATIAVVRGVRRPALTYIGSRPTFHADRAVPAFEVHVLDLQAELYGLDIEVEFVRKLRDDARFPTREALIRQMDADCAVARELFRSRRPTTGPPGRGPGP